MPRLVSCRLVRLSPKLGDLSNEDSEFLNLSILLSRSAARSLTSIGRTFLGLLLTACSGIAALEGLLK